ncbi:MAG: N-acetyltransferase [Sphingomonas bacterium]|nr:GNAT family N-acetyltransferase [Sphingomonas bacterium]MDB5690132.1 N-acetyltransferase [Sphingomonas bacterium]
MALTPVAPGQIATIVTSLQMLRPPAPRPMPASPLRLARWQVPRVAPYRGLFRRVGEPWLWFSRLVMDDAALTAIIADPAVEVLPVIDRAGIELGLLELDFRESGQCELSFVGLVPELTGKGHGRWLMAHALSLAWRKGIERVWVHTCTLDHPAALGFYRKSGFVPFATAVETFADPRLAGVLSAEAAPHVPMIAA